MIHNYGDHGYCLDQNHWIMRNYDLFFLDHGFTRIMTTWSQELLRSKPWDHCFFDLGSKKMQIVRSRDHIFEPFFLIQSKKITDITLPKISGSRHLMIQNWVFRSNNNWTHFIFLLRFSYQKLNKIFGCIVIVSHFPFFIQNFDWVVCLSYS